MKVLRTKLLEILNNLLKEKTEELKSIDVEFEKLLEKQDQTLREAKIEEMVKSSKDVEIAKTLTMNRKENRIMYKYSISVWKDEDMFPEPIESVQIRVNEINQTIKYTKEYIELLKLSTDKNINILTLPGLIKKHILL